MGFAIGCVGMSLGDFRLLTPGEFGSVGKAWGERRETSERGRWERMRLLASISIQPHVRRRLTPERLLPLPWDKEKGRARADRTHDDDAALRELAALCGKRERR